MGVNELYCEALTEGKVCLYYMQADAWLKEEALGENLLGLYALYYLIFDISSMLDYSWEYDTDAQCFKDINRQDWTMTVYEEALICQSDGIIVTITDVGNTTVNLPTVD